MAAAGGRINASSDSARAGQELALGLEKRFQKLKTLASLPLKDSSFLANICPQSLANICPHGHGSSRCPLIYQSKTMKKVNHAAQNSALALARRALGNAMPILTDDASVKRICEDHYGRSISRQLWDYWKAKVRAQADPEEGMTSATAWLLITHAKLLAGQPGGTKVSRSRLAKAAIELFRVQQDRPIPETCTYAEVLELVTQQTFTTYTDRHLRRYGLLKSKDRYNCLEVQVILSRFPNHEQRHAA